MQRRRMIQIFLGMPILTQGAAQAAQAEREDYSLWITFRDFRYRDLGLDFRYTVEEFVSPPNNLWFQFRNRRTRPIRFKYDLRARQESGIQEYGGVLAIDPQAMSRSRYVPGSSLYRIYVDIEPDEYDRPDEKQRAAIERSRQPASAGELSLTGRGLPREPPSVERAVAPPVARTPAATLLE